MDGSIASGPKSRKRDEEKGCEQPCPLSRTTAEEYPGDTLLLCEHIKHRISRDLNLRRDVIRHLFFSDVTVTCVYYARIRIFAFALRILARICSFFC